jgi:hydroxymethylbilane synthase
VNVRIGTRGSALALAQSGQVGDRLADLGAEVELVSITTSGDKGAVQEDTSRFVQSSLRRQAQLLAARPDLDVAELRGNVDTRLRKLADGDYDAIVLAAAGLSRLERASEGNPIDLTPAAGQGCLALEARADNDAIHELAAQLTDRDALIALTAERAVVTALDATCRTPVAAYARLENGALTMDAFVGLPDGSTWIRDELNGDPDDPAQLGTELAQRLIAAGANEVLAQAERAAP